jgi:putative FmdB family regulatory protein
MPIYEYQALDPEQACRKCRRVFEVIQGVKEKPLKACPDCGARVKKQISRCRAAIAQDDPEYAQATRRIKEYESQGMYSHAAELADKQAARTKDKGLKTRALDNYSKAGYDSATLDAHDD